jgi:hypothetical protein
MKPNVTKIHYFARHHQLQAVMIDVHRGQILYLYCAQINFLTVDMRNTEECSPFVKRTRQEVEPG